MLWENARQCAEDNRSHEAKVGYGEGFDGWLKRWHTARHSIHNQCSTSVGTPVIQVLEPWRCELEQISTWALQIKVIFNKQLKMETWRKVDKRRDCQQCDWQDTQPNDWQDTQPNARGEFWPILALFGRLRSKSFLLGLVLKFENYEINLALNIVKSLFCENFFGFAEYIFSISENN